MPTRTIRRRPSASRKSPKRTPCCPIPRNARSTTDAPARRVRWHATRGPRAGAGASYGRGGGARAEGQPFEQAADFGDFGGLGDIFSSIFGRGRREEPVAETLETVVEVPFRIAVLGGKVPVTLAVTETCPTCQGSGGAPGATWSTCPECNGRGTISFGQGGFRSIGRARCAAAAGKIPSEPCPTCAGAGEVRTERRVAITVPAGTETGTRVRLRGQGQPAQPGAPPGDLAGHLPGARRTGSSTAKAWTSSAR